MGTVTTLRPTRDEEGEQPHTSGSARCLACQHEFVCVAPIGEVWLPCPKCSLVRGRFVYPHARREALHWTCKCDNDLFHLTPDGVYCPNCGSWQCGF